VFFGKDQGLRIRDLQDPAKKMSKSADSDKGVIFLTDVPDEARKKVMSAETDSLGKINYDYDQQPGISNLLDILTLLDGKREDFIGQEQYGPLKTAVADKVVDFLQAFQVKLAAVDQSAIDEKLTSSEKLMADQANQTLYKVQKAVGLRA
jgi:tryptophanyl-tRNA synthetase